MGVSMSLVERVTVLTTVDECIKHVSDLTTEDRGDCVSGATC